MSEDVTKRPFVSIDPGMQGGAPCINGTRLTVSAVVGTMYEYGLPEVMAMWDYITRHEVLVACWYVATYRGGRGATRKAGKAWGEWGEAASGPLWSGDHAAVPDPPTRHELEPNRSMPGVKT